MGYPCFHPANFWLHRVFRSRIRSRHVTDRRTNTHRRTDVRTDRHRPSLMHLPTAEVGGIITRPWVVIASDWLAMSSISLVLVHLGCMGAHRKFSREGLRDTASAKREPMKAVWGWDPGAQPLVRGSGAKSTLKLKALKHLYA